MDYYLNTIEPKPQHGHQGEYRRFMGEWYDAGHSLQHTNDRFGHDIYCANCNHWSTVKDTNILYSVVGKCKVCNTSFR